MKYISNAFSLQMQGKGYIGHTQEISLETAREMTRSVEYVRSGKGFTRNESDGRVSPPHQLVKSIIGHDDICSIINAQLDTDFQPDRKPIKMNDNDTLIVGQYSGGRLPSGTTQLPEGAEIRWFKVTFSSVSDVEEKEEKLLRYSKYGEAFVDAADKACGKEPDYRLEMFDQYAKKYFNWYEYVKFEDIMEASLNSPASPAQQLKAEIAALASELDCIQVNECDIANYEDIINRMRQLSAV